jgi:peptidoglycan/LPS O-acetylase OafA/YrhL
MPPLPILSALAAIALLAAHGYRSAGPWAAAACVLAGGLAFVRRPWARRALQALLALGFVEWLRAAAALVAVRQSFGQPWARLALILAAVALFTLAAAILLESARSKARFRRPDARED